MITLYKRQDLSLGSNSGPGLQERPPWFRFLVSLQTSKGYPTKSRTPPSLFITDLEKMLCKSRFAEARCQGVVPWMRLHVLAFAAYVGGARIDCAALDVVPHQVQRMRQYHLAITAKELSMVRCAKSV